MTVKNEKDRLISELELISDAPVLEATELLIHATGIDRRDLLFKGDKELNLRQRHTLKKCLKKRKKGLPLQYILGEWEFFSSTFKVGRGVLIPRPETEMLVELAIDEIYMADRWEVFDLCAGSGAIGISIKKNCPETKVTLVEKSKKAFEYLKENAKLNKVDVNLCLADVADFMPSTKADIIVSNPPYINDRDMKSLQKEVKYEPTMALSGGKDGLNFYRLICGRASKLLKTGGILFFEIGYDEAAAVTEIMHHNGFTGVEVTKDYSGLDRIVSGKLTGFDLHHS